VNGTVRRSFTHLTFPPQYWHWGPCQPSWHTQVPFWQTPLPHSTSAHLSGAVPTDAMAADTNVSSSCSTTRSTAVVRFRRYLDLNRNKNMSSTRAFMTQQRQWRRTSRLRRVRHSDRVWASERKTFIYYYCFLFFLFPITVSRNLSIVFVVRRRRRYLKPLVPPSTLPSLSSRVLPRGQLRQAATHAHTLKNAIVTVGSDSRRSVLSLCGLITMTHQPRTRNGIFSSRGHRDEQKGPSATLCKRKCQRDNGSCRRRRCGDRCAWPIATVGGRVCVDPIGPPARTHQFPTQLTDNACNTPYSMTDRPPPKNLATEKLYWKLLSHLARYRSLTCTGPSSPSVHPLSPRRLDYRTTSWASTWPKTDR